MSYLQAGDGDYDDDDVWLQKKIDERYESEYHDNDHRDLWVGLVLFHH